MRLVSALGEGLCAEVVAAASRGCGCLNRLQVEPSLVSECVETGIGDGSDVGISRGGGGTDAGIDWAGVNSARVRVGGSVGRPS